MEAQALALAAAQAAQQQPPPPPAFTMTQAQLEQLLAAAVASAITANRTAPTYNEVPGGNDANAIWDFSAGDGLKLFLNSTKPIDPIFDGKQSGLRYFLRQINDRAETFGWQSMLVVPNDKGEDRSIPLGYGALTIDNVKASVEKYAYMTQSRSKQGSIVLRKLIASSISQDLYNRLLQVEDKCTVLNQANTSQTHESGALMLFALISLASIEVRATVANLISQLNHLDLILDQQKDHNIIEFNTTVTDLMNELRARDVTPPDITTNLFNAYKLVGDKQFTDYIGRKEEAYEDGSIKDFSAEKLMEVAREKFKVINGRQEWRKKTKQELEFIAMTNAFNQARDRLTQNTGKPRGKPKDKDDKPREPGRPADGVFAWKNVAPKAGERL